MSNTLRYPPTPIVIPRQSPPLVIARQVPSLSNNLRHSPSPIVIPRQSPPFPVIFRHCSTISAVPHSRSVLSATRQPSSSLSDKGQSPLDGFLSVRHSPSSASALSVTPLLFVIFRHSPIGLSPLRLLPSLSSWPTSDDFRPVSSLSVSPRHLPSVSATLGLGAALLRQEEKCAFVMPRAGVFSHRFPLSGASDGSEPLRPRAEAPPARPTSPQCGSASGIPATPQSPPGAGGFQQRRSRPLERGDSSNAAVAS
ncbi:uncharacterized protein LOC119525853 [Choloepus didactylus]|uniref:uncharacterized protein LOC119525853 n=1 Tax=Choloepus didactylus TaxID=27675 RepID=UPI00189D118A|nr:uncharacterized protein LOC119525853 [Choloepus didactylus]